MSDERPVDPADSNSYRDLFRPDPAPAPDPEPIPEPMPELQPEPMPELLPEPMPELLPEPMPAPGSGTDTGVDTGRLFRSARVAPDVDTRALPAVLGDQASRLRTLVPTVASASAPETIRVDSAERRPAASLLGDPDVAPSHAEPEGRPMPPEAPQSGVRPVGVYAITIGATVIAGAVDIVVGGPGLGFTTGLVLLVASVFCALRVRTADAAVAVIAPPIAFLVAVITVGQIGLSDSGGFLGRMVETFFMLADNWAWIIGSTIVALAIVLVRGRLTR